MPESYGDQITEDTVARWARLRREGHSYDAITKTDPLSPSYPTIKKYLEQYGYDTDGRRNGEAPAPQKGVQSTGQYDLPDGWGEVETGVSGQYDLPDGWGEVETGVSGPQTAGSKYAGLLDMVQDVAGPQWARVKTDYEKHPSYVMEKLKKSIPGIEVKGKKIDGEYYLYFRLKGE